MVHSRLKKEGIDTIYASHAILLVDGNYVLQLRDNKSTISAGGKWSLFGGRINVRETPLDAIKREIGEELSLIPIEFRFLWRKEYCLEKKETKVRAWFFVSDISSMWHEHTLLEGQDVGVFSFEEIKNLDMPFVIKKAIKHFHKRNKYA